MKSMGISEAAMYLGVSRKWIYELVYMNRIKAEKNNGKWVIPEAELIKRKQVLDQLDELRKPVA